MRALSLLLRRAAVAGPSVPAETSALGSRARVFLPRPDASAPCPQPYEDSSGAAVATAPGVRGLSKGCHKKLCLKFGSGTRRSAPAACAVHQSHCRSPATKRLQFRRCPESP